MQKIVREFEAKNLKSEAFDFQPGDTVRVSVRIVEGGKERLQDFEGVCIRRQGGGMGESFTVRRISYGVGMERIFPLHSPRVSEIKVVRRGRVRRANLSYLRARKGKKARITEDLRRAQRQGLISAEEAEAARQAAAQAEAQASATAEGAQAAETPATPAAQTTPAPSNPPSEAAAAAPES